MVGIDVTCENGIGRHITLPKTFTPYRLYDYIGNVSDSYYTGYPLTTSALGIISEPIYESTTSFAFYAVALSHGNSAEIGKVYWVGCGNAYTNLQPAAPCEWSGTCTPPVADFEASPREFDESKTVQFTDLSVGATAWSWKKRISGSGDAFVEFSTVQNPSAIFSVE